MLLTGLIVLPLLGALPLLFARDKNAPEIKVWAFLASLTVFMVSLPLWTYRPSGPQFQWMETHPWIQLNNLSIGFNLGVDGVSSLLILLTTFITPIAILGAWNYIHERQKEFYIAMLLMETAMIGVFAATDLFLFYIFFEASLIPMYLLIGVWGGDERLYATTKFILFTAFGSLLMFVAILFVYFKTGAHSFGITELAAKLADARASGVLTRSEEFYCFWAFALSFAIKIPLFPVHTWLPDAHVQAPTPGSVILAAVLLKMGGYGFIRLVMPFFPRAMDFYTPTLMILCIIGIIYGSMMAFSQRDIKKLIAYSSVAHMGTCMLGIFSQTHIGVQGGVYQMLNHGISTSALFLLVGMLYERTHTRAIDYYGGIAKIIPVYTVIFVVVTLSSIGLPLTNGFIGEFCALLGTFFYKPWYAFWAATGIILGAVYMLYLVKRVFFGRVARDSNRALLDLSARELVVMVPLVLMIFIMGLAPKPFFDRMEPAVATFLKDTHVERDAPVATASTPATVPTASVVEQVAAIPAAVLPADARANVDGKEAKPR